MPYAVEFSAGSERDFERIYDHLFESYVELGDGAQSASIRAEKRLRGIRKAADRLSTFPDRGIPRDDILAGARSIAFGRAVYWYDIDRRSKTVRILVVFFGGQDHIRRMLIRALRDGS
jgi:plasmid stabilization system protein ParE